MLVGLNHIRRSSSDASGRVAWGNAFANHPELEPHVETAWEIVLGISNVLCCTVGEKVSKVSKAAAIRMLENPNLFDYQYGATSCSAPTTPASRPFCAHTSTSALAAPTPHHPSPSIIGRKRGWSSTSAGAASPPTRSCPAPPSAAHAPPTINERLNMVVEEVGGLKNDWRAVFRGERNK